MWMEIVDRAVRYQCCKVQFFKPWFNRRLIERAHDLGMRCNMFWSDDPAEAREMFEMGIDTILSNDYWNIARVKTEYLRDRAQQ